MKESTESITAWATDAFGSAATHARIAARANEEMAELLLAVVSGEPVDLQVEEAADVAIVLHLFAGRYGRDLDGEIARKMATNRSRRWAVDETGCGYHVPDGQEPGDA